MLSLFVLQGEDLETLLDMGHTELVEMLPCRVRRRFLRASHPRNQTEQRYQRKYMGLIKKLRKAKDECEPLDKPKPVKTHLRNAIILPEMVGSVIAVYNGKAFSVVEVKPEMIGRYMGEFSITYKPTLHTRPNLKRDQHRFIP